MLSLWSFKHSKFLSFYFDTDTTAEVESAFFFFKKYYYSRYRV